MFHYVRQKKYDIICLQDVYLESKMEAYVQREWGYDIYMSPFLSNRRGVLTLINNTFEYDIGQVKKDPNGNFLITELTICGKKVILHVVNIYGPNEDNPQFYSNIQQHVFEIGNENIIFCGDWNLILNPILDSENYRNINNPRAKDAIIK